MKIKQDCESQVEMFTKSTGVCNLSLETLRGMLEDVKVYINTKRAESMQSVNNALRMAEEIVPDSEPGAHFELDGDKAVILTEDGLTVNGTEGGGFRQVSSVFLRSVIAKYNMDILDTILLDEVFSQLSVENSATLSLYLNIITQEAQVISIEQKQEVYGNIDYMLYRFDKTDGFAEVTKHEVKRGEVNVDAPDEGGT